MNNRPELKNTKIVFTWLGFAAIYVVLFEFVFSGNKIFPRPTILLETVFSLEKDYRLLNNFFYSFSGVYLSILISYFLFLLLNKHLIFLLNHFAPFFNFVGSLKYFPLIGIIAVFIYWFPDNVIAEFLSSILFSFVFLVISLNKEKDKVKQEYLDSAISLVGKNRKIISEITFKSSQPEIIKSIEKLNILLWSFILLYEYIKSYDGVGSIFRNAVSYTDFSALIVLSVILFIIISVGNSLIRFIQNKFYRWES
jgi:ABC-type nitrate/sulfonate/bicarbonate transport system permease component